MLIGVLGIEDISTPKPRFVHDIILSIAYP